MVQCDANSKDYRPDLKQLLFILTISADGAVPIAYRVADGNTPDDLTHVPTWDALHALVGRPGFLYVADSKLCSKQAMGHIHSHGGRFVTIVPHGRREDTWFRDWAQTHAPAWAEARRAPGARHGDPDRIWRTFQAPAPSADGYRVIWVHSSSKAARDAGARATRIEAGLAAIDAVQARLASPKSRIKTKVAAEQAATTALQSAGATRWVGFTITETIEVDHRQEKRGRPGSTTRYRRTEKPVFTITAAVHAENVSYDAVTDGCFPLITNDTVMTAADVLAAYHYQPNLERRNHLLKGATGSRTGLPRDSTPHRSAAAVPLPRHAHRSAHRTRDPHRDEQQRPGRDPALPRTTQLPRPQRTTHPGDLHRPPTPPTDQPRRSDRADLPTSAQRPTTAGAGPPPHPNQHLQLDRRPVKWGAISTTRSAERQFDGRPGINSANADQLGRWAIELVLANHTAVALIDEVHFIDVRDKDGVNANNHLKYLADVLPVTSCSPVSSRRPNVVTSTRG